MMGHNMAIWSCEAKGGGNLQRGNEQEKRASKLPCVYFGFQMELLTFHFCKCQTIPLNQSAKEQIDSYFMLEP